MDLIGSAARREVEESAADLPEFRREVGGLQRELLRSLPPKAASRPNARPSRPLLDSWPSKRMRKDPAGRSVHLDRVPTGDGRARRQLHERERIADRARADAEIDRQLVDGLAGDGARLLARTRSSACSRPTLTSIDSVVCADAESHIHARRHRHLDVDIGLLVLGEPGLFDGEVVDPGRQRRQGVVAGRGGDGFGRESVSLLTNTTFAPGITAPLESTTVPVMVPRSV